MSIELVKSFMREVGWGFLATSDSNKVGVRPMGSCVWMDNEPKCCIKYDADMLKNLCKATRFDYDTHDCTFNL